MDCLYLEYARKRAGKTKEDMASAIGKCVTSYGKKERGEVKFTDQEKTIVCDVLALTTDEFNRIFFDSNLPIR